VEPRDIVERRRILRQAVGLAVVDHLQPMLDRAQQRIGAAQHRRVVGRDPAGRLQRGERVERRRGAQGRLAAAMDELLDLGEEFDLADAAAAALQIEAGAEGLALRIMVADAAADRADLADRAEIERAPPDEGMDRLEEIAAERDIAGDHAGADERGALPGQSGIRNRRWPHRPAARSA
jgi:hypothetical protein